MQKIKCPKCQEYNSLSARYCSYCGFELPITRTEPSNNKPISISKNKIDNKKIIGIVVGAVTFFIAFYFTQELFSPSMDKQLVEMANELNKNCPIMIDQYTRLDNANAFPNKTFQYNYTLVETEKADFNLDTVRKYVEPNIINNVKSNPDMKDLRDNNVTLNYSYRDKNGEFIWKLEITPDMYQK